MTAKEKVVVIGNGNGCPWLNKDMTDIPVPSPSIPTVIDAAGCGYTTTPIIIFPRK